MIICNVSATFPANSDKIGENEKPSIINPTTTINPMIGTMITFAKREIIGILWKYDAVIGNVPICADRETRNNDTVFLMNEFLIYLGLIDSGNSFSKSP